VFSGIVEANSKIVQTEGLDGLVQIIVKKPEGFDDIRLGDSIATNGVCLTAEKISDDSIQFSLGQETLNITGWTADNLKNKTVNLERSLKFGDRIHGHLVSGHVDTMAKVSTIEKGESWFVRFDFPKLDRRYLWTKGSVTLNGVSLTVNRIVGEAIEVCLIPETILRTNLKELCEGDPVTVEYDYWAKAFVNFQEQREMR
jgi:riboflavin synthase